MIEMKKNLNLRGLEHKWEKHKWLVGGRRNHEYEKDGMKRRRRSQHKKQSYINIPQDNKG